MSPGHGAKWERKREALIAALLSEETVELAARRAKVSERTARVMMADADFQAAYRQARRAVVEGAVARLQQLSGHAVTVLGLALGADRVGDRIKAACAILDRGFKGVELLDILERVEQLEERAKGAAK